MADNLPLLVFPRAKSVKPPAGKPSPRFPLELPTRVRQIARIDPKISAVRDEFQQFAGRLDGAMEPEMVLVLELADRVDNLQRAVEKAGIEWLGEWDAELDADDDFPSGGSSNKRSGRVFVSMFNQRGIESLLSLWRKWQEEQEIPRGQTPWKNIFACLKDIRRWGIEETLVETGMQAFFSGYPDEKTVPFQVECFYHQNLERRKRVEAEIANLVVRHDGRLLSQFLDMPEIGFHAVKAEMHVGDIKRLMGEQSVGEVQHLFIYPHIMYFRRTGQSVTSVAEGDGEDASFPTIIADQPPVAAVLDGVPNLQHQALQNNLDFDDPFDLAPKYQVGERKHGTAMASLVIHGDISNGANTPIRSKVSLIAVMQPDEADTALGKKVEHFSADCFYEDRIEQAVRRVIVGEGDMSSQTPTVKIINISLGDSTRPFIHTLSPWARLLDWLSWKYRILFCVSAGNYSDVYNFGITTTEWNHKNDDEKNKLVLQAMQEGLSERRIFAPAESINALTVGALHDDNSGDDYRVGRRLDLLPNTQFPSPISCFGHGFRRSVKPEIYFPGGRQLYREPYSQDGKNFEVAESSLQPGQQVATDSTQLGDLSKSTYSRGTSNATALATRAGIQIHEVLDQINNEKQIPDNLIAVLIKALLVHGSKQSESVQSIMDDALRNTGNSRKFKSVRARFLGYGAVDVGRVLSCTAQRGTVIGFGEIGNNEMHEYRFPIPDEFGGQQVFRRMVVTLAWFTPINPRHRYLREAKLEIKPVQKWDETPLKINRVDGDHNQVKRGTVQHEVLEGESRLVEFQQEQEIVLQVTCKKDATDRLDEKIPYGLAVTLEAEEASGIPVYDKIKERLEIPIAVELSVSKDGGNAYLL